MSVRIFYILQGILFIPQACKNEQDSLRNEQDSLENEQDSLENEQDSLGNKQDSLGNEKKSLWNPQGASLWNELVMELNELADLQMKHPIETYTY